MPLNSFLEEHLPQIEHRMKELIPQKETPYKHLFEAAQYALNSGGKKLRPLLTLATVKALKGPVDFALTAACAIELVHTYSLIHDDLPCMDDDDLRRGKPTVHKVYDDAHAVLTGDYLLTLAFDALSHDPLLTPQQKISLISTLAKAAGSEGLLGGQVMDLMNEGKELNLSALDAIHQAKTGALIQSAIEFGAIIAYATPEQKQKLRSFGQKIGLAYQIVDDVLDVTSEDKKRGKDQGSDASNNKSTYATILGLKEAQKMADSLLASALTDLQTLPQEAQILEQIAKMLIERKT